MGNTLDRLVPVAWRRAPWGADNGWWLADKQPSEELAWDPLYTAAQLSAAVKAEREEIAKKLEKSMKTEKECETLAHQKLTEYVNSCKCGSKDDVSMAIQKMVAMSMHALDMVENGGSAIVQ